MEAPPGFEPGMEVLQTKGLSMVLFRAGLWSIQLPVLLGIRALLDYIWTTAFRLNPCIGSPHWTIPATGWSAPHNVHISRS